MTEEVIEQNPTENVLQTEVVQDPVVVDSPAEPVSEVVEEVPAAPVEETTEAEDKRKNPWFLKRISAEAEARRIAEQRAADAEAMLERIQKGGDAPPATPAPNAPDFQTAVQREAARLRLAEESTAIRDAGYREFGRQFGDSLAVLNAAGAVSDDIVLDLIAVDKPNAHKILANLAQDPERATALAAMDPRRRTAELTRISMAANATTTPAPKTPAAPAAKQVSKAPAPPPPVEPSASKTVPWYSDDASDAEFDKGFYSPDRLKKRQRL
jgi:hypothetical protein